MVECSGIMQTASMTDRLIKEKPKAKGVGNSTTLANNAETEEEAYTVLKELAVSVSQRLKKHHFLAAQISTEIKYASFRSVSHQTTILTPTAEETEIYQCACQLFNELWDGEPIRLLGIRTTKLQDEEEPTRSVCLILENTRSRKNRKN